MLGRLVRDPYGCECGGEESGLGLLPVETVFGKEKFLRETKGVIEGVSGVFSCLNGQKYTGYEIHMGVSDNSSAVVCSGNVYGTYIHGIFDEAGIVPEILRALGGEKVEQGEDVRALKEKNYNRLAEVFEQNMDVDKILKIIDGGCSI